jgi:uncharacterized membrane protein YciS (DUF1049 family)
MPDINTSQRSTNPLTWLIDPLQPTGDEAREAYRTRLSGRAWALPLLVGAALLVVSAVGWAVNPSRFYFSYLTGWVFCLSLALGSLFFVMVHHAVRARWFTVVRRVPEALAWSFPLLALLFIPILFGMHDLFHWTAEGIATEGSGHFDEIIAGKKPYLNAPFFYARMVLYFAVWTYLAYRIYTLSLRQDGPRQDEEEENIADGLLYTSVWGLPVYALTTTFASFDLLMSLDPHWFSTIFGVYFFAGSFLGGIAVSALFYLGLQRSGMLRRIVTTEHYHDFGKYLFAFTAFWAYIAFSQYVLIWYSGIPEETVWFRHRFEHGWDYHTLALVFGHFAFPFLFLMPRFTKRLKATLGFMAVWMLVMQWFDMHWLVVPNYGLHHEAHGTFHWLDFTCALGLLAVMLGVTLWRLRRHALVPQRDPHLRDSLRFTNL